MKLDPDEDGITHINVYSKGKTELGRFLSNFTYAPITTEDGNFNSIEGYWYWLGCIHADKNQLRSLYGFRAKQVGRELGANDWIDTDEFKRKISTAIVIKINSNKKFKAELINNKLPLTHYYVYGGKIVNVPKASWILEVLEVIKS